MPVRSTQLGAGQHAAGGQVNIYTVPAGKRTIVRSFVVLLFGAGPQDVALGALVGGGATQVYFLRNTALGQYARLVHDPWSVLNAGDKLTLYCGGAVRVDYWASGAELLV